MEVLLKKLHKSASIPQKAHPSDFCYDCVAISEEEIAPNVWKYGLGIAFQIIRQPETMVTSTCFQGGKEMMHLTKMDFSRSPIDISIDVRPRSSVWKTGMVLSNCEGTVDENYRGEVSAVFYHVMPNMPRYKVGQKVCQIKLGFSLPMDFVVVDQLSETDRGEKGYGSSGL